MIGVLIVVGILSVVSNYFPEILAYWDILIGREDREEEDLIKIFDDGRVLLTVITLCLIVLSIVI